jgi:membrane-bound lytic murein transglycosylase A
MIGQDTGSAILGAARGDVFFGSGDAAGALAGTIRHPATFTVLLPRDPNGGDAKGLP